LRKSLSIPFVGQGISLKKEISLFRTVSSRLAIWYAMLFAAASVVSLLAIYMMLSSTLREREDKELSAELREFEMLYKSEGMEILKPVIMHEAESEGINRIFIKITSPDNTVLASSDMTNWKDIPVFDSTAIPRAYMHFESFIAADHQGEIRIAHQKMHDGNVITIGMTTESDASFLSAFIDVSMTTMFLAVIIGSIASWYISRGAMFGVERVRLTASSIGREDISTRVPIGREGLEVQNLASTFNAMLDRIESLILELKDVTNNIAHELRSPLTRMRGIAEGVLTEKLGNQDFQDMAATIIEECDHLSGIINTMLEIAETDSGVTSIQWENINLTALVRKAHEIFLAVAESKQISFVLDIPESDLFIIGDTVRLRRCISNILDNAFKYTPQGGSVVISTREASGHVEISVTDTGEGIDEYDLPRIFEKFYRSDKSRSTPGNGLGLSLVQSIVKAHGGVVTVTSKLGEGTSFKVRLPVKAGDMAEPSPYRARNITK